MNGTDDPLAPYVAAVVTTLRELAGAEVVVRDHSGQGALSLMGVTAVLRLIAPIDGWIALRLPADTATALARRVMKDTAVELDDAWVRDCSGELVNVIAGQAKALTFGTPRHFSLGLPIVGAGDDLVPSGDAELIEFEGECGPFSLLVCLPGTSADCNGGGDA